MSNSTDTSRRAALQALGGAGLAALGLASIGSAASAQDATPVPAGGLQGAYSVVRVRRVKPEFSASDVSQSVAEGFVSVVRDVPGFVSYFVVADDEHHIWASVGVFADKAGSDESTERAAAFGQQGTDDMIDGDPIIIEGPIEIAAP